MLEEHKETLDDLLRERLVKQIEIATKKEELETIELKIVTMLARSSTTPLYVDWKGLTARHCRNAAGSGTNREEHAFVRVERLMQGVECSEAQQARAVESLERPRIR